MERSLGMLQKGCWQFSHPSMGEEVRGGTHSPHAHCACSCRDTGLGAHPSSPSESLSALNTGNISPRLGPAGLDRAV